jgi:hypothetical protein
MDTIEYGKIYSLKAGKEYSSQAVYLGDKLTKRYSINKHFFMIWEKNMQSGERPKVIACQEFKIKENKLELSASRRNYRALNKPEEEYLKELAKKYWG